jgi:type IV pilus assembly protein PilC
MTVNFKSESQAPEPEVKNVEVEEAEPEAEKEESYSKKTEGSDSENKQIDKINAWLLRFTRVPLKERLFFVQNLGLMLRSGISLSSALFTLSSQTPNKRFQAILKEIGEGVESGHTFAEVMKKHHEVFGEMFISMVEAGELSGKLEEVLGQLYIQMKKENGLISKVKGALTYPAVIILAMFGIGGFMIVFIIPKITAMFTEMNVELPLPTKILINISNAVVNNGLISAAIFIVFIFATAKFLRHPKGKFIFQAILLKMPVISPIVKKINLARFARNISSLLKTDIMIIKSFQITANVLGNLHYRNALLNMAQRIKKGGKLSEAISEYPHLFTPVVAQMIAIGEETGELDNILIELATFYEEEVDLIMENLPSIIEPILILALGLGVGGVAIAIIMPMYSITEAI